MVKILVAGDFCPTNRVATLIEQNEFEAILGEVKPIVEQCDYSIVNFECPVLISRGKRIKKVGPSLKCTPKAISALQYAHFSCVTLANNHFYDQGEDGVKDTIEALKGAGISHVGGGHSLKEAAQTLFITIHEKTVALINCCEHEFSIATNASGGSNPLNILEQFRAIREARNRADYVIVIVHGGIEHFQFPSQRMVDTYRFFVDIGADAIVNHHQHCFSGYEVYKGKPIFYGLGNFCFDRAERSSLLWEEGLMVVLCLEDSGISYRLLPYNQNGKEIGVHLKDEIATKEWEKRFNAISEIITDENKLEEKYVSLTQKTERIYSASLTPYSNRISLALYMRHLLPMLLSKKKLRILLDLLMCESHYDRMIQMLKSYSN